MSGNGSIVVIVNQNGHLIYSPQTEGTFKLTPEVAAMDLREAENPEVASLVRDALGENTGLQIIDAGDEQYYAVGAPIANVGWAILSIVPKSLVDSPTLAMETIRATIPEARIDESVYRILKFKQSVLKDYKYLDETYFGSKELP